MTSYLRPARIALIVGLVAAGGSVAEAGNFGANLSLRTSVQSLPQMTVVGRHSHVGFGTTTTPPPYYYPIITVASPGACTSLTAIPSSMA